MANATFRGLALGEGTQYRFRVVPSDPGITARQAHFPNPQGGELATNLDVPEASQIVLDLHLRGTNGTDTQQLRDALVAAWAPAQTPELEELTMIWESGERIYRGRPKTVVPLLDRINKTGSGSALAVFKVMDYRWYNGVQRTASTTVPSTTGGLDTPIVTPIVTTGGGSSGDMSVVNEGTAPAPWQATLVGPLLVPRLILGGEQVRVDADIPDGTSVDLDSRKQTVTVGGVPRPWVSLVSRWFELPPGNSTVSLRATSGTGSATINWRDASY